MIPDDSQDCSGLEAVTNQHYSHDTPSFEGMQVVPDSGIQVNFQKTGLEVVQNDHNPELCSDTAPGAQHLQSPRSRRLPRKWLCSGGFAIFLIVAAAVLGGVLGTRANSKLPSASSSTTPSSSSDHSTTVNADNPVQSRHNLAALSFALDSVDTTRVYYQDNAGEIVEAATSTEHSEWIHNNLGFFAKNGSAIGAAVSRPGFIPEITVLYTDSENLLHNIVWNSEIDSWIEGDLANEKLIPSFDAGVSVVYHQCVNCSNNTIIAFQDVNGFVQIGNRTSHGWILTQVDINPINNTGLALAVATYAGLAKEISMYYQAPNLNLRLHAWRPANVNLSVARWLPGTTIFSARALGTPIAVAAAYSNSSKGFDSRVELLSLSDRGIMVDTYTGQGEGWIRKGNHPTLMTNSTANPKTYGSLATTANGKAFAIISTGDDPKYAIESWRVADDLISWTSTGTVDIGNAWG